MESILLLSRLTFSTELYFLITCPNLWFYFMKIKFTFAFKEYAHPLGDTDR